MKNKKNLKCAVAFALVSAVCAAGIFAAPVQGKKPPKPEQVFLERFGEAKVFRGGIVTDLSLDTENEKVTMKISFGSENLEVNSDGEIQFVAMEGGRPPKFEPHQGAPKGSERPRHEVQDREHEPREEMSNQGAFKLGDRVFVIFSADGKTVEKVVRAR